jgi:two-component system, OmpR family, phosphate regulon sensor histidine kinase PhoR
VRDVGDGLILVDAEGKIALINGAAASALGVAEEGATGKLLASLPDAGPDFFRIREALRKSSRSTPARSEVTAYPLGQERTFVLSSLPLPSEISESATLVILQDVTTHRDQERARIDLIATLSRELRTPLTSIGLAAQLLDQGISRRRKLIKIILAEFARLDHLADELLDATREDVPRKPAGIAAPPTEGRKATGVRSRGKTLNSRHPRRLK